MTKITVFYSWQSWTERKNNYNFIGDAIKEAIKPTDSLTYDLTLDRDTLDTSGAVTIVDTIFEKIEKCYIFICDVTPVATLPTDKNNNQIPNPNVLLELGFAVAHIGWSRVILVANSANLRIEELPFDLRGRKLLRYRLGNEETRAETKRKFSNDIRDAIDLILRDSPPSVRQQSTVIDRVKGLLQDGTKQIELEELVQSSFVQQKQKFDAPEIIAARQKLIEQDSNFESQFNRIFDFYFEMSREALEVSFLLAWYGNDAHVQYISEAIQVWGTINVEQEKHIVWNYIPCLVLVYIVGIAATYKRKYSFLKPLASENILDGHSMGFRPVKEAAIEVLTERLIRNFDRNFDKEKRQVIGKWLYEYTCRIFEKHVISKERFDSAFDIFEQLMSLVWLKYTAMPYRHPEILWQHGSVSFSFRSSQEMLKFWYEGGQKGNDWELIKEGILRSNADETLELLKEYQGIHGRYLGVRVAMHGVPDYVNSYERGLGIN